MLCRHAPEPPAKAPAAVQASSAGHLVAAALAKPKLYSCDASASVASCTQVICEASLLNTLSFAALSTLRAAAMGYANACLLAAATSPA